MYCAFATSSGSIAFFFRRIFVYLFFRPRFFVHAFAILAVLVSHFFVCEVFPL